MIDGETTGPVRRRPLTVGSACHPVSGPAVFWAGACVNPWEHLKKYDSWIKPESAEDDNAHLMVQCMESWLIADRDVLRKYFGPDFNFNALPARNDIENIRKSDLYTVLKNATRSSSKGEYDKGHHSFDILAGLDPDKVMACSPHAQRLVNTLRDKA